jgi:hypothetical protein
MGIKIKPKTKKTEAEKKADIEKRAKARLAKEKYAQAEEQGYKSVKAMDKKRIRDASKASKQEEKTKRIAIRQGEKTARVKARHGASAEFPEIKKGNEGKFTAWVEKNMGGMDTCKAASKVMRSRTKKYSPAVVKMANYANNFGCKNKKDDGASVPLKGKQKNLPDALKSKILASDGASIKKPRGTKEEKDMEKFLKKGGKAVGKRDNKVRRLENKVRKNNITEALMLEKKEKTINKAAGKINKASDKHLKSYVKK